MDKGMRVHLVKNSDIQRIGTGALIQALGPIGMARCLEAYDHGGIKDHTKEKYGCPDHSIEEIAAFVREG